MDKALANDSIRVIQITDTHVLGDPTASLMGIPTLATLAIVLRDIEQRHRSLELLLVTGDLSQDGTANSYRLLQGVLGKIGVPVVCIPGNHDDPQMMSQVLPNDCIRIKQAVDLGNWRIVSVDSTLKDAVHGAVSRAELARLDRQLADANPRHCLVTIHHPPVRLDSRWMDDIGLVNGEDLFQVLDRHANVRALAWGHAHQEFEREHGSVKLFGTPSTCFQFKPHSMNFALDTLPAGYRSFDLKPNGAITTEVVRIPDFPYTPNAEIAGYN